MAIDRGESPLGWGKRFLKKISHRPPSTEISRLTTTPFSNSFLKKKAYQGKARGDKQFKSGHHAREGPTTDPTTHPANQDEVQKYRKQRKPKAEGGGGCEQ